MMDRNDEDEETPADRIEALATLASELFDPDLVREALAQAMQEIAREEAILDIAWSELEAREMLLGIARAKFVREVATLGLTLISHSPQPPANEDKNEN